MFRGYKRGVTLYNISHIFEIECSTEIRRLTARQYKIENLKDMQYLVLKFHHSSSP